MEYKSSIFKVNDILNPQNKARADSFISCEDRCNKLEVRRSKTKGAYS